MVSYSCAACGREVQKELISRKIRCPFCDSKVLKKDRSLVLESIRAR